MSVTTAPHPRPPRSARLRALRVLAAPAVLVAVALLAACIPPPAPPATTTTTTTSTTTTTAPPEPELTAICRVWEQRNLKGPDGPIPPQPPFAYLIDDDTVVRAFEVVQVGDSCTANDARLTFFNGELIGRDLHLPADNSLDGPPRQSSPYSQTLAPGQQQAPAVEIASLHVELTPRGIRIWGTLRVTAEGAVSTVSFDGTLRDLQNFSVELVAPSLLLPGLGSDPVSARGRFERHRGVNSIELTAAAPSIRVDDLLIKDARLEVRATTTSGIEASVSGNLSSAGQQVDVQLLGRFDAGGRLVELDGRIDARLAGAGPDGWWELDGTVTLTGDARGIVARFAGRGRFGPDQVARAAGTVTWSPSGDVTLVGVFDVDAGGSRLQLEGTVTFNGSSANPTLAAVAAGAFVGTTDRGEVAEIRGTVRIVTVGGVTTTTVQGVVRVGGLSGNGSAVVEVSGDRTTLRMSARVASGPLIADVTGDLVLRAGEVESVDLQGNLTQPLLTGGVRVEGAARLTGDRSGLSVDVSGLFRSVEDDRVDVSGRAVAWFDASGGFRGLRGFLGGTVSDGVWRVVSFLGSFTTDGTTTVLTGTGLASGPNLSYGQLSATLTITPAGSRLDAQGQVAMSTGSKRVFGDVTVIDSEIVMARAALVFPPILIDPERIWVRVRYDSKGCAWFVVLESTFLIGIIGADQMVRSALACAF
jgi:hypothetical protein